MLEINYRPHDGQAIPDGDCKDFVSEEIAQYRADGCDCTINVATELVIQYFRLAIITNVLKPEEVVFTFDGKTLHPNEYGNVIPYPNGFADISCDVFQEIVLAQSALSKENRMIRSKECRICNGKDHPRNEDGVCDKCYAGE